MSTKVVALACSDIHFSDKAPLFRQEHQQNMNWIGYQMKYFSQILEEAERLSVPILIAGDLFDTWKVSNELVGSIIRVLRMFDIDIYAIPGQHDLPNHDLNQVERSAYGVLVAAGVICDLSGFNGFREVNRPAFKLTGYAWNVFRTPAKHVNRGILDIAMAHRFVWKDADKTHVDLQKESGSAIRVMRDELAEHNVIITGDNHLPFQISWKDQVLQNCGTFFRRKRDEIKRPSYYEIRNDGSVKPKKLDVSLDLYSLESDREENNEQLGKEVTDFLKSLKNLAQDDDLSMLLKQLFARNEIGSRVRSILSELIN